MSDAISGETVTYAYDSLNRLISASGTGWSQTQAYDGLRQPDRPQAGTTISTPVNAATNQLSGYTYDNNGNLISTGYTYDAENRIEFANAGGVQYFYDGQNKRIWQTTCTSGCTPGPSWTLATEQFNMFGADGKQLASYGAAVTWTNSQTQLTLTFGAVTERAYFGGKLVAQTCTGGCGYLVAAGQDRLGSVGKYYPYGEDRSGQLGTDTVRFATYTRDSATGNDYADQRYYTSVLGRFMTPDRTSSNAMVLTQNWNKYSYVGGDPVNKTDPAGTCSPQDDPPCYPVDSQPGCEGDACIVDPGPGDDEDSDVSFGARPQLPQAVPTNSIWNRNINPGQLNWYAQQAGKRLSAAIKLALKALANPGCTALYDIGGALDPTDLLEELSTGTSGYGYFELNLLPPGTGGTAVNAQTTPILPNLGGTFSGVIVDFNIDPYAPFNSSASPVQNAITVLHELGHVYEFLFGQSSTLISDDMGNNATSASNTKLVQADCFPGGK